MKLSLRLIVSLVVSITLVTFLVARSQVRTEKRGLRTDLVRRAEILTESLQETVEPVVERGSTVQLQRLVERFGDREHLEGVAVYDPDGRVLAVSRSINAAASTPPAEFNQAKTGDRDAGGFETIGSTAVYVEALPLHRGTSIEGVLVTFHNAAYIEAQSTQIWRDALGM
jgi:hypothetical protein